jgi:methyl halide transferase
MNHTPLLDETYWNNRYANNETGWDMRRVSPPIKAYIDQLANKQLRILIPGCGNSYEAEYLAQKGFTNITLIDIAPLLVNELKEKFKNHPSIHIIHGDFFELKQTFDLVLEQTFFCAIDPALRKKYAAKMQEIIVPGGKLAGLLFNCSFEKEGPPFGGTAADYKNILSPYFQLQTMEPCYNSHPKRMGTELFVIGIRK